MATRNVYNVEEVEGFVETFAAARERPEIADWLRVTVRRWILKGAPDASSLFIDRQKSALVYEVGERADGTSATVPVSTPGAGVPKWCIDAFARFEWIYYIHLNASLHKRVIRTVTWLEAEFAADREPRLDRLSFTDAEKKSRLWRASESKRRQRAMLARGETPVFRDPDGSVIVQLLMTDVLEEEGKRLANCLADYDEMLREGEVELYVLRDRSGKTRAAIEVGKTGRVWQVKGPNNGPVQARYRPLIRQFIQSRGFRVDGDAHNVALLDPDEIGFTDVNQFILSATGERLLAQARYSNHVPISWVDTQALLWAIVSHSALLMPAARRAIFEALRPLPGEELRQVPARRLELYGAELTVMGVSVCASLFALATLGIFHNLAEGGEAASIRDITERQLAALAFAEGWTLFDLGQNYWSYADYPVHPQSAADVLAASAIDIGDQRRRRQVEIRKNINLLKAETVGRNAPPSAAHLKVRTWFDGEDGHDFL